MNQGGGYLGLKAEDRGRESGLYRLPFAAGGSNTYACTGNAWAEGAFASAKLLSSELGSAATSGCWGDGSESSAPNGCRNAARQSGE